jgi:alpha-beta hydrolase superfamily lysophospholipase
MVSNPTGQRLRRTTMTAGTHTDPRLVTSGPRTGARAVVLLLHGGQATGTEPAARGLAYLRMAPFARSVVRATRDRDVAVWLLRYRVRGWNEPVKHPLQDGRWALGEARRLHPDAPLVLIGHSMGGRVALRLTAEPGVAGVCALAPWVEFGEPAPPRSTASVLIAHGDRDRVTDPEASAAYAARIGATFVPVPGEGHAMLRRPIFWSRLVTGFVASTLGVTSPRG